MAKTKKTSSSSSSHSRKPSSSSTRAHNQSQAQLRTNRNNGGNSLPKSIQEVYDFAVESTSGDGSKKGRLNKGDKTQQRAMRRAMAGMQDSDPYADLKSKSKGKGKQRDRDQEDDDDESIDDEDEADEEEIRDFLRAPKVFDDLDELNAGIEGDDEDIDSDEAFGESDEERFEGWTFSGGKGKRAGKSQDDDDDEEEEEEEEDEEDGDDMMDLSRLLDGDGSENDDDDDSDDQDSDLDQDSSSSQQGDSKLQAILSNLSAKRSLEEGSDQEGELSTNPSKKQRKVLSERTESMPESEFASGTSSQQLRLEDLLSPLNGQNGLTSLRNSTKALISSGNNSDKKTVASKKGGGTLNAPLPSVVQDRLDRKAAYELTKDEVEGWKPTIKRLREAQHLSFPLQETKPDQTSTASLTSNFKAQKGGIEDEISKMLNESGMTEKQLKEEEELKMKELDPQEVKRRRDELKKMRELMFRAELKAKRISKIKSKAYRKINRKEKERERLKLKEAGLLNGDDQDDQEMDEEERMKMERERAKERATLKHKNTSKWAKNSLNRNHQTAESRNAIEDQLRRGEELRRKIHGLNSDSDEDDSDDEEEDEEDGREKIFDELKSLERRDEKQRLKDEEELDGKHKNVMNMKFMKDARKKTEAKNRGDLDEFQNQMERMGKDRDGETLENEEEIEGLENKRMIGSGGRAVYGNGKIETRPSNVVNPFSMNNGSSTIASDSTSPTLQASDDAEQDLEVKVGSSNPSGNRNPFSLDHHSNSEGSSQAANPWLSSTSKNQTQSKKKNQVLIGKEGKASDKLGNKVEKQGKKSDEARRNELEDAKMEISLTSTSNNKKGNQSKIKVSSNDHDDDNEDGIDSDFKDSDEDEDEEVEEPMAISGKGIKTSNPNAFKQRKLVAQAFSGDDVSSDFALQKSRIIEQDAPKVEDLTLPGWGSWGGEGIKKPKSGAKKKFLKEIKGLDPEKRKDFNLKNVIINERKDKKNEKYKAKDLPFPYTSKAQYEMDMKNSLGKEWNTITQNQRLTLPKVVTKPGKVIKPIERKF